MKEKIAIITGGAGDIGQAICFKLASEGVKVVIIDINDSKFAEIIDKSKKQNGFILSAIKSDVSDYSEASKNISYIADTFGNPSILVNCAGIIKDATILNMTTNDFDSVINVNLKGVFNYIKAITPTLKKNNYGKIVNIASINALRGKFGQANYVASKAGIIGLTKTAAIELSKYNINVNAVAPGMIRTSIIASLPKSTVDKATEETLLGKIGEPDDVAELVNFLVSDKAKHITGEVIKIDGGQYL